MKERLLAIAVAAAGLFAVNCKCPAPTSSPPKQGPASASLDVKFEEQQGCHWCWAATAAMVSNTLKQPATQCGIAQLVNPGAACCPGGVPPGTAHCDSEPPSKPCDEGGWPPFKKMGVHHCQTTKLALSFEWLTYEIGVHKRPVVFAWQWANTDGSTSDGGHLMVAGGYKTIGGDQIVETYNPRCMYPSTDPAKPCGYKEIPYTQYVAGELKNGTEYVHWDDFYEIRKP